MIISKGASANKEGIKAVDNIETRVYSKYNNGYRFYFMIKGYIFINE